MLIAHATDLTGDDEPAFVHATAVASAARARLVSIHANAASSTLPDAKALATRWGRSITHDRLCHDCCDDVADTVIDALATVNADLVVLGTHGRHGFAALTHPSVGEAIARNITAPVLVVPNRSRGFVDADTGAIDLSRIVISAATADEARHLATIIAPLTALASSAVHVEVVPPRQDLASARDACLLVLPTHGHDRVSEVLFGSHAEHVLRDSGCPVLLVPMPAH